MQDGKVLGRHRNNGQAQGQDDRLEGRVVGIERGREAEWWAKRQVGIYMYIVQAGIDAGIFNGKLVGKAVI